MKKKKCNILTGKNVADSLDYMDDKELGNFVREGVS